MFGIGSENECDHRDSGKSRMRQNEEDVLRLVSPFKKYDVFRHTTDLVAVTTGMLQVLKLKKTYLKPRKLGKPPLKSL